MGRRLRRPDEGDLAKTYTGKASMRAGRRKAYQDLQRRPGRVRARGMDLLGEAGSDTSLSKL